MKRVIQGDALEELRSLPSDSVDLVLTDPPYNVNYKYASYADNLAHDDYLRWQLDIIRECERVLKTNGSLFYLNYPEFNSRIYANLFTDFALKPIEIIAWIYNTHTSGNPLRKSFRTWIWASKGKPQAQFFGVYKNPTDARVQQLIQAGRSPNEYDWWHFEQVKNVSREKTAHPCQLPLEMVKKIIEATTKPGDVVLDPFLGSGTTAVAAQVLNRDWIGIEMEEQYIDITRDRLNAIQLTLGDGRWTQKRLKQAASK